MAIKPPPPIPLYGDLERARQIARSWKPLDRLSPADAEIVARAIAEGIAEGRRHGSELTGALAGAGCGLFQTPNNRTMRAMVQERPARVERRLSAILAADVVGYSRLMHNDEEATHAKLTTLLSDAVAPAIADHGGHIVKRTGDGFLAEFPSAVEAVRAALQLQTHIKELTARDAEDRRIAFRVGMNVGDVIIGPHDVFGDGVNIAVRLESIAEPGGICISSSVHDHIQGGVGVEFADLGEQNLKNIGRPVRAFAAVPQRRSPPIRAEGIGPITRRWAHRRNGAAARPW